MKAILEFELPEDNIEFQKAMNANKYYYQVEDIWNELFIPFYKDGYPDPNIQSIIEENPEVCEHLINYFADLYRGVVDEDT